MLRGKSERIVLNGWKATTGFGKDITGRKVPVAGQLPIAINANVDFVFLKSTLVSFFINPKIGERAPPPLNPPASDCSTHQLSQRHCGSLVLL